MNDTSEVDALDTERHREDLRDLDKLPIPDLVSALLQAEARVPQIMAAAHPQLSAAASIIAEKFRAGGRLIYVGAGTPGRIAASDAAECPPTYGVAPERVVTVMATAASTRAGSEAAEDDVSAAEAALEDLVLTPADVVVGITASGRTPFVAQALRQAQLQGVTTIVVTNNAGSVVADHADVTIELLTGAEVVAGSTRLTAGTSQKIALNILSTAAMVATGHTYGPWMTRMRPVNGKLGRRAIRIVGFVTSTDDEAAIAAALSACSNDIELASLMVTHDLTPTSAASHLTQHSNFRVAMETAPTVATP